MALFAGTAQAQTADPNQTPANPPPADSAEPAPADSENEEIVVTGIRASLQQAIEIKRRSDAHRVNS